MRYITKTAEQAQQIKKALYESPEISCIWDIQRVDVDAERLSRFTQILTAFNDIENEMDPYTFTKQLLCADCLIVKDRLGFVHYDLETAEKLFQKFPDLPYWMNTKERFNLLLLIKELNAGKYA